jgi:hypothetical protein
VPAKTLLHWSCPQRVRARLCPSLISHNDQLAPNTQHTLWSLDSLCSPLFSCIRHTDGRDKNLDQEIRNYDSLEGDRRLFVWSRVADALGTSRAALMHVHKALRVILFLLLKHDWTRLWEQIKEGHPEMFAALQSTTTNWISMQFASITFAFGDLFSTLYKRN